MSKQGQMLRNLVTERLNAAAEEIFALFEKAIAEYEEEWRSKEENQNNRGARTEAEVVLRRDLHCPTASPRQKSSWSPQIKVEPVEPEIQCIKEEDQDVPVCVQQSSGSVVKEEVEIKMDSKKKDRTEVDSEETENSSDTDVTDNDDDWGAPSTTSSVQMDTQAEEDQLRPKRKAAQKSAKYKCASESSSEEMSEKSAKVKIYQCSFCDKTLLSKKQFQAHLKTHSGDNPYTCTICKRVLASKTSLMVHTKQHTREKPNVCHICKKAFTTKTSLLIHAKQHMDGTAFSCSFCKKEFAQESILQLHLKTHSSK